MRNLSIILFVFLAYCSLGALAKYYCPQNTFTKTIVIDGTPDFGGSSAIPDENGAVMRYFARDSAYYYYGIQIVDPQLAAQAHRKYFFVSYNPEDNTERFTFNWDESKPIITSSLESDPEMECVTSASYSECRVKNLWNTLEIVRSSVIDPLDYATVCSLDFSRSEFQKRSDLVEEMDQIEYMLAQDTTNTTLIEIRRNNFIISGALASAMLVITFVLGIVFLFRKRVPDSVAFAKKDD